LAKCAAISLADAANNAGNRKAAFGAWRLAGSYIEEFLSWCVSDNFMIRRIVRD